ncbi:MAG: NAD(+)/NADH kinase [Planctomycetia bacterium]
MQSTPPRRFLILGNGTKAAVPDAAEQIGRMVEQAGGTIVGVDLTGRNPVDHHEADLAIVLGGDGAILRAAYQLGAKQIPVVGVNLGRLGFLAELSAEECSAALPSVLAGEFAVSRHLMLDCFVDDGERVTPFRVLNEIRVTAGLPFQMIDVALAIDGEHVATYSGDGLIVGTPIGSTAHNLAAGGPILSQTLPAVVVTPICPFSLTWRPLVESADRRFELHTPRDVEGATLIVDGHLQMPLTARHGVRLQRSAVDFQLVRIPGRSYYKTLTAKLHWGARPVV